MKKKHKRKAAVKTNNSKKELLNKKKKGLSYVVSQHCVTPVMARTINNNSFYLHLDSSVDDKDIFIENNLGDFSQFLYDALQLECKDDEHWEVALEQLVIPNALTNIYPGHNEFEYSIIIHHSLPPPKPIPQTKVTQVFFDAANPYKITVPFTLSAGYYDTMSFAVYMNKKLSKVKRYILKHFNGHLEGLKEKDMDFRLHYSSIARKFYFHSNPSIFEKLTVKNEKLQKMLGLTSKDCPPNYPELVDYLHFPSNLKKRSSFLSPLQPNLNRHFQKVIVYCDIAQESIVNDKYASVLRVFDISTILNSTHSTIHNENQRKGDNFVKMPLTCINPHIQRLHFFPLNTNTLQKISIKMANEFGEDLVFCDTKDVTHVVLFFKKIKNASFNSI